MHAVLNQCSVAIRHMVLENGILATAMKNISHTNVASIITSGIYALDTAIEPSTAEWRQA